MNRPIMVIVSPIMERGSGERKRDGLDSFWCRGGERVPRRLGRGEGCAAKARARHGGGAARGRRKV
jgi:hypothetical protein